MVHRIFIWGVSGGPGGPFKLTRPEDFAAFDDLRVYAQGSHVDIQRWLESATEADFNRSLPIPWFTDPPLTFTVTEALMQCAMHSHHHRGQNATRLRELGATPPSTDLIVWYWKGKPEASW